MNFCDVNPFVRYVGCFFHTKLSKNPIFVSDCRILYAISGEGDIFIKSEHYNFVPGSLFYCSSGNEYLIQSTGIKLIALNFDLTQRNNMHTEIYPRIDISKETPSPLTAQETIDDNKFMNSYLFVEKAGNCLKMLENILHEFSTSRIFYREKCSALLKGLFTELYRCSISDTPGSMTAVSQIIDYIQENYSQSLNNDMLSAVSGYHPNYLNRLFQKHTGTSIHKYILNVRLSEAKKMLLNTDYSLSYIAEKVGFNSNTHFSNYFKQTLGISPLAYRKQYTNGL